MTISVKLPSGDLELDVKKTDFPLEDICCFATRANNKRGFLFVSKVLGKHYPVKPKDMHKIYKNLSDKLNAFNEKINNVCFIGFAETAIGLGAGVFNEWQSDNHEKNSLFMPTSRFKLSHPVLFEFQEEHSHATDHLIYQPLEQKNQILFKSCDSLVLIDDEISTGKTLFNFIEQYKKINTTLKNVFLVSIKNWISDANKELILSQSKDLNINFISVLSGEFVFNKNPDYFVSNIPKLDGKNEFKDYIFNNDSFKFRYGYNNIDFNFDKECSLIDMSKKTLILGSNEFLIKPYFFAKHLEKMGMEVYFQSTTRSPIILDVDIKQKNTSLDNYNDGIENYVYNVDISLYEQIVLCVETKELFGLEIVNQLNATIIYM